MPASLAYELDESDAACVRVVFSMRVRASEAAACVSVSPWRLTVHAPGGGALAQLAWAGCREVAPASLRLRADAGARTLTVELARRGGVDAWASAPPPTLLPPAAARAAAPALAAREAAWRAAESAAARGATAEAAAAASALALQGGLAADEAARARLEAAERAAHEEAAVRRRARACASRVGSAASHATATPHTQHRDEPLARPPSLLLQSKVLDDVYAAGASAAAAAPAAAPVPLPAQRSIMAPTYVTLTPRALPTPLRASKAAEERAWQQRQEAQAAQAALSAQQDVAAAVRRRAAYFRGVAFAEVGDYASAAAALEAAAGEPAPAPASGVVPNAAELAGKLAVCRYLARAPEAAVSEAAERWARSARASEEDAGGGDDGASALRAAALRLAAVLREGCGHAPALAAAAAAMAAPRALAAPAPLRAAVAALVDVAHASAEEARWKAAAARCLALTPAATTGAANDLGPLAVRALRMAAAAAPTTAAARRNVAAAQLRMGDGAGAAQTSAAALALLVVAPAQTMPRHHVRLVALPLPPSAGSAPAPLADMRDMLTVCVHDLRRLADAGK